MSQPDFTFKDFIPPELYSKWFDVISKNEKVYVCVIQNDDQINTVYLEHPRERGPHVDGLIRVFFDLPHLKRYGTQVAMSEGIHPDAVRRWELKFTELFEYVQTMDTRRRQAGKLGIMAIASSVHAEKFVELDTIWTSDMNLMV